MKPDDYYDDHDARTLLSSYTSYAFFVCEYFLLFTNFAMGVPKFFRWLSERYPAISQLIAENRIPEFDCLYLDMNGIIHNCTHKDSDDAVFRLTEEEMFIRIFNYIEHPRFIREIICPSAQNAPTEVGSSAPEIDDLISPRSHTSQSPSSATASSERSQTQVQGQPG